MIKNQIEILIFFIPIVLSVFITLVYLISATSVFCKSKSIFYKISIINVAIFLSGGVLWFILSRDGLSQITGGVIYIGTFIIIEILLGIKLYFIYKKSLPRFDQ